MHFFSGLAILSPEEDISETEKPFKEKNTPLENVEMNEKESRNEADANEDVHLEITEMDAKQNDINKGFRRFFSNIGLKLTVKRGLSDTATDVPDNTNKEEPNITEDTDDTAKGAKSKKAEQNTDENIGQETYDSTTCPTLTDVTSEDVLENAEETTTDTKEEVESDNADAAISLLVEDIHQDATPQEEPHSTSPTSPEDQVVTSPIKRFFATGMFSGLRKKKKLAEDETVEKELEDMGEKDVIETTEQTVQDQQQGKEVISQGVVAEENDLKGEILSAASAQMTDEGKSSSRGPSTSVTEPEILSSQEKDKVHASPLKRFLSGSNLKKLSKTQRSRKSSDAKLPDSGEHVSDQLLPSESAENHKEGTAQTTAEAAREEDGAWASFKKLVTPKKRKKRSSLSNEESQIPGSVEEPKQNEREQMSDHSTEEGKKRKDSSVSWEAVLCGSGRRRSRKTSDSEDETPQIDISDHKQDGGSKHGAESPLECSNENENEILASSPKQAESPLEGDGGSTWKSLKRIVTPKRKAKDEDERMKDNIQSDSEFTQDDSSFSVKNLLPGRKKRKSDEKQIDISLDKADNDVASGDEDSETPGVVPLSEYDMVETEVHIQTQPDIESHIPEDKNYELQQDLLDQMAKPVLPSIDIDDALEKQASTTFATNEEPDDLTESVSKYQQLSDIPEEGLITETMVTPASVPEEAATDETIAEDLIEITSEAITAPEPATDITLADETEMISAVSQLSSESTKTSGNTTPVQTEYDIMETDTILHQVTETISISPKAVLPLCSDGLSLEKIVGSVSHQILEAFVEKQPTILEIHRRFDATAITTGLNVEELDAINELAAESIRESISEVNDFISTEAVSEVANEEFDTAEIAVDEIQESVKELERIDESHHLVESPSEINTAVSADILPEGDKIVPDVGYLVDPHRAETEPLTIDSQEADSTATATDETKDGAMEQEVQTVTEKEDQIMHSITDQIQVEDKEQPSVEVEELQELAKEQVATLDTDGNVQSPEEEVKSEDIPPAETVTDEPKQTTEPLTIVSADPENKELPVKAEHVQEPEVLEAVQAPTLNSEECSVQSLKKEVISENLPEAETVTDKPKGETILPTEVNLEPVDASKTVQEPEVLQDVQVPSLDSEEGSIQSFEKDRTEHVQVPEVSPSDVKDVATETKTEGEELMPVHVVTECIEEGSAQELEKQIFLEEITKTDTNNVIVLVTDKTESEVVAKLGQALEITEDQKTESIPQDAQIEQEDFIAEVVDELQTLTAVHVPSVNEESSNVQVLGKPVYHEETPAPCVKNDAGTDEPKHEVHLSAVQISAEQEKEGELPGTEPKTAEVEHAVVTQVVLCKIKEASVAIPDVSIEKTSEMIEPVIDTVAIEQEFKEEFDTATPLVKDDVAKTAEEGSMVVMMHVPSVTFEDNHRIQVQAVDVDIKSAETIVDSVLKVGVTEAKDLINVCRETVKKVDNLSATTGIEEELINEQNKVTFQEVIQHGKEALTEIVPESVLNLEQEDINYPLSEMGESETSEVGYQTAVEDSIETFRERQDEEPTVISDYSPTEQQVSMDLMETPDIQGSLEDSIHDHKEDLEETKAEREKSKEGIAAEEVKSSSEDLDLKKRKEQAQIPQISKSPIVTSSNTEIVAPQNTEIISSIGNVESLSSLSLEFKLNIQFGQPKAPASPPPTTETIAAAKQTDASEVRVQAVKAEEPVKPINPTQRAESQKQTGLTEVAVQATENTERAASLESTERGLIMTQSPLLDVSIQVMETAEPVEQIKSTDRVTSSVQPIKQKEEETDQDVWMDAEEVIYTQEKTEVSFCEEPLEPQTASKQEEKAGLGHEAETAPNSKIEEEEREQEMHKTGGACQIESENEDFAVAHEHLEKEKMSITAMEFD